eukprot:75504_1
MSEEYLEFTEQSISKPIQKLTINIILQRISHMNKYSQHMIDVYRSNKKSLQLNYSNVPKEFEFINPLIFDAQSQWIQFKLLHSFFPNLQNIAIKNISLKSAMDNILQHLEYIFNSSYSLLNSITVISNKKSDDYFSAAYVAEYYQQYLGCVFTSKKNVLSIQIRTEYRTKNRSIEHQLSSNVCHKNYSEAEFSRSSVTTEKIATEDYRLFGTELDDVEIYNYAQIHSVNKFPYGARMKLFTKPKTQLEFEQNFRIFCKYNLHSFIVDYFEESCKDYAKILNNLFDSNKNKSNKNRTACVLDRSIINIVIEYIKPKFSVYDLFLCENDFHETGLILAAKYGQYTSVEIIIKYAKKYKMNYQVINHIANGGTALHWLFTCYSDHVFEFLERTQSIRPTMMLLLKNGANVALQFEHGHATNMFFNVMELAKYKNKKIEAEILETFLKFQLKQTKTPAEYAKTKKKKKKSKIHEKQKERQIQSKQQQ